MDVTTEPLASSPLVDAIRLCNEISAVKLRHWWDPSALQCRGCIRFSADVEHRCSAAATGNRGCGFVNARWNQEHATAAAA